MSDSFYSNADIISCCGLLAHSVCTIKPKNGAFGENQKFINSLCKGVNSSNFYDIFSDFDIDEIKTKFVIINNSDRSEINWDALESKLNIVKQEKELIRLKQLSGQA
ncbi:hypothetical protein [Gluconacetobacter diazotrophicus]|uniref:hypothetical protein n=1 Tax=Gluconacetobacter diazotrophicus TaxID=33996 RepID=UPI0011A430A2|nr:hypothetical protein [Gluconacetobacter diazotrophicus]